jgi:hypothetical protein
MISKSMTPHEVSKMMEKLRKNIEYNDDIEDISKSVEKHELEMGSMIKIN